MILIRGKDAKSIVSGNLLLSPVVKRNKKTVTKKIHVKYLQELVHECVDGKLSVDVELEYSQGMLGCQFSYLMLNSCL